VAAAVTPVETATGTNKTVDCSIEPTTSDADKPIDVGELEPTVPKTELEGESEIAPYAKTANWAAAPVLRAAV